MNYSDPTGWKAFEHAAAFFDTDIMSSKVPVGEVMSMIFSLKAFDHNAVDSSGCSQLLRVIEEL